jgi:UDPglucose 6-dehydrogenase
MYNSVHNKILGIFGVAFKKNTNDVRESPALKICYNLLIENAILHIYDPKVTLESFKKEF